MPVSLTLWQSGGQLVDHLKEYYYGKADKPSISERTALLSAFFFTILYIAPFYISSTLRSSPLASRDDPVVIKARTRAVILSCAASVVITVYILRAYDHAPLFDTLHLLGLWPIRILDDVKALALVGVLFVGPLYESLIVDEAWRDLWSRQSWQGDRLFTWVGYRNYVIAPISEELVFRSLVITLYLLAHTSPLRIVFLTPLIFGVAHVHHFIEFIQTRSLRGRHTSLALNNLAMGALRSVVQFTYTSLFGFFAAFLYLRTGNLLAAILVHAFCNWMEVPRFWGRVGANTPDSLRVHITPDLAQGKREENFDSLMVSGARSVRRWSVWALSPTVLYYVLLLVGAYGFYALLWPLTESPYALAKF